MEPYYRQAVDLFSCEQFHFFRNVAAVVGVLYLLKVFLRELWTLGGGFCAFFLAPWGISRTNLRKYGEWAVITGASEGIGRGYALELARQGLNVVIMSRSREKLDKVADEIKKRYQREVRVIPVDFLDGQEVYPRIEKELMDLEIGVLVNNVGISYEHAEFFTNVSDDLLRKIIELNCQALVQMTRLLLPKMAERGCGLVVNISSSASARPVQLLTVYSASKLFVACSTEKFVNYFSDALRKEYASKGIEIQNVMPYFVDTKMSPFRKSNIFVPSPEKYTRTAVATIGIQKNTTGCWIHAIQGYVADRLPSWLWNFIIWRGALVNRRVLLRRKAKQKQTQ